MNESIHRLTLRIPMELYKYMRMRAERKHRTFTAELVDVIRELKEKEPEKKAL